MSVGSPSAGVGMPRLRLSSMMSSCHRTATCAKEHPIGRHVHREGPGPSLLPQQAPGHEGKGGVHVVRCRLGGTRKRQVSCLSEGATGASRIGNNTLPSCYFPLQPAAFMARTTKWPYGHVAICRFRHCRWRQLSTNKGRRNHNKRIMVDPSATPNQRAAL